jgi:hypothetical protein
MRTDHPRSMLKARIELLRCGRLTNIESVRAHINGNSDLMAPSRNVSCEERACNRCGAEEKPKSTAAPAIPKERPSPSTDLRPPFVRAWSGPRALCKLQ